MVFLSVLGVLSKVFRDSKGEKILDISEVLLGILEKTKEKKHRVGVLNIGFGPVLGATFWQSSGYLSGVQVSGQSNVLPLGRGAHSRNFMRPPLYTTPTPRGVGVVYMAGCIQGSGAGLYKI